jgi:aryl-alcohol dehydrogenase-like predicted oxidoreductase
MTDLNYRTLGPSALRVSELCLGTMTFGADHAMAKIDADAAREIIALFRDAGGNFIDTANMYTGGQSEELIGRIIAPCRDEIVLATKYGHSMNPADPNAGGMHRKNLVQAVERSLKRLKTDYIDLYWIHSWDRFTQTDEVMRALDDLVRAGKILHIGASNTPAWRVAEANAKAQVHGATPFTAVQVQYSLVERTVENEVLPMARASRLGVLAWSPLGMGVLTGKYLHGQGRGRLNNMPGSAYLGDRSTGITRIAVSIAEEIGATPSQVALAWVLAASAIPIIGGSRKEHFVEAIEACSVVLSVEQRSLLEVAGAPQPSQPGALFPRIDTMVHGDVVARINP